MKSWDEVAVLADSDSLTAGEPVSADITEFTNPTVLVTLEDLEGATDDTATVRVAGEAATYPVEQQTLGGTGADGTFAVDVPQADSIELESGNGVTYSAEVRANA